MFSGDTWSRWRLITLKSNSQLRRHQYYSFLYVVCRIHTPPVEKFDLRVYWSKLLASHKLPHKKEKMQKTTREKAKKCTYNTIASYSVANYFDSWEEIEFLNFAKFLRKAKFFNRTKFRFLSQNSNRSAFYQTLVKFFINNFKLATLQHDEKNEFFSRKENENRFRMMFEKL